MLDSSVFSAIKDVAGWIFPFFKDNKALAVIKSDMQSVGEEFLVRMYDKVKNLFSKDERRKSVYEEWLKAIEQKKPDVIAEGGVRALIENEVKNDTEFRKELEKIFSEIEQYHPQLISKNNNVNVNGNKNITITDVTGGQIHINKDK